MPAVQLQGAWERGLAINFNTSQYCAFSNNGAVALTATEADRQELFPTAGKLSAWGVYVSANTIATSDSTLRLRINGSNASMVITIAAGQTGWISVPAGSVDTVAAGDKVAVLVTTPNTSGSLTITNCKALYTATGGTVMRYRASTWSYALNGVTRFTGIVGSGAGSTAETMSVMRTAGTITGLHFLITGSARAVNDVVTVRKNGVDTSMTVTINGNGTYTDTSHPVTVAVGDQISVKFAAGASASSMILNAVFEFVPSTPTYDWQSLAAQGIAVSTTNYFQMGGSSRSYSTEAQASNEMLQPAILSFGRVYVTAFSLGGGATATMRLRVNAADGNQTWSINTTGEFKDLANTDRVAVGDLCSLRLVVTAGTGTVTVSTTGVTVRPVSMPLTLRAPLFIGGR